MNISSISYRPAASLGAPRPTEASEAPGPDRDGDSDDVGSAAPAKSSLGAGVGRLLDMLA